MKTQREYKSFQRRNLCLRNISSLEELRQGFEKSPDVPIIEAGTRSAIWKASLVFHTLDQPRWLSKLGDCRTTYDSLRTRFLSALNNPNETDSSIDPLSESLDVSLL